MISIVPFQPLQFCGLVVMNFLPQTLLEPQNPLTFFTVFHCYKIAFLCDIYLLKVIFIMPL